LELPTKFRYAALFAQACLVYLPLLQYKAAWLGQPGFVAGSALIVLPPLVGVPIAAFVVVSVGPIQAMLGGHLIDDVYIVLATMVTGLVMYGLTWFTRLVAELQAAREEMAEMAVSRERLRFARDLHDLLGYNLSAITLKVELTTRLMIRDPTRAQQETDEILQICRQSLADVRAVARSYREMSLADECDSARLVLAAAGVHVQMDVNYRELPIRVSTVLATVLREGITNLLRHSKAESCEISVQQVGATVSFEMRNDGASQSANGPRKPSYQGGSGLHNLSIRVAELGGVLTAARQPDGGFRLYAAIPLVDKQPTPDDRDEPSPEGDSIARRVHAMPGELPPALLRPGEAVEQ